MEEELRNLIKVWITALISISYCYYIPSKLSKGFTRLVSLIPIFIIFLLLPLLLSSVHFCIMSAVFLTWLANFKLLLFAFDQEPLSPLPSSLSGFFFLACFPIKISQKPSSSRNHNKHMSKWAIALRVLIFSFLLHLYSDDYHHRLPRLAFLFIFIIHVQLATELILYFVSALLSKLLGCEIEPVFNEPYLSTSLQDFWSHRWNRMVSALLRQAVHKPIQRFTAPLLGLHLAFYAGVLATFLVSGLMHELIYFYIIRKSPTWEVTWFFILHGVVTSAEIVIKNMRLLPPPHRVVSLLATAAFVIVTAGWLFVPQLLREDVHQKVISECLSFVNVIKYILSSF